MRTRLPLLANVSHWGFLVGQNATHEITKLLQGWQGRDRAALDGLLPAVYEELRRLAHCELRHERPDHTLQSAALVNEAYLRLFRLQPPQWESRTHFFAVAAQLIRRSRVAPAGRGGGGRRGFGQFVLPLEDASQLSRG